MQLTQDLGWGHAVKRSKGILSSYHSARQSLRYIQCAGTLPDCAAGGRLDGSTPQDDSRAAATRRGHDDVCIRLHGAAAHGEPPGAQPVLLLRLPAPHGLRLSRARTRARQVRCRGLVHDARRHPLSLSVTLLTHLLCGCCVWARTAARDSVHCCCRQLLANRTRLRCCNDSVSSRFTLTLSSAIAWTAAASEQGSEDMAGAERGRGRGRAPQAHLDGPGARRPAGGAGPRGAGGARPPGATGVLPGLSGALLRYGAGAAAVALASCSVGARGMYAIAKRLPLMRRRLVDAAAQGLRFLPGDSLRVTCEFDSTSREEVTHAGSTSKVPPLIASRAQLLPQITPNP